MREYRTPAGPFLGLLLGLLLVQCSGVVEPAEPPFGGSLSAPLPFSDVLGLARFEPGGVLHQALTGNQVPAPFAPLFDPLRQAVEDLFAAAGEDAGTPLVAVFLDAAVHGASVAFALPISAAELRARSAEFRALRLREDQLHLPALVASGARSLQGFLESLRPGEAQTTKALVMPTVWQVVDGDDGVLLLPARDGLRNVQETLTATRALEPVAMEGDYLRLRVRPVVRAARPYLQGVAEAAQLAAFMAARKSGQANHGGELRQILELVADLTEDLDELYVRFAGPGSFDLSLRTRPGPLAELLACLEAAPARDWLRFDREESEGLGLAVDYARLEGWVRETVWQRLQWGESPLVPDKLRQVFSGQRFVWINRRTEFAELVLSCPPTRDPAEVLDQLCELVQESADKGSFLMRKPPGERLSFTEPRKLRDGVVRAVHGIDQGLLGARPGFAIAVWGEQEVAMRRILQVADPGVPPEGLLESLPDQLSGYYLHQDPEGGSPLDIVTLVSADGQLLLQKRRAEN